jgi:putative redox protein
MTTESVSVEWVHDHVFLMRDHQDFPVVMTQPMGVSGADLLPLSLVGCAIWDVMAILLKQRQKVSRCEVSAESERDADPPWRFRRIRIVYHLTGKSLDEKAVERAIRLVEEKYCSVYATLKGAVELVSEYQIQEDGMEELDKA